ncbi:MAG: hypothetical protein N3I35_12545 [Clostridia bacterium]|nr:hypothetical protein [Clostridia bacterium]
MDEFSNGRYDLMINDDPYLDMLQEEENRLLNEKEKATGSTAA